ncbi:hypothetical protein S40285_05724 [Stachybotrys chlorohalonatus IBT 40285]|uniref:Zn(2)-C6 fungal-type domain-containing protein n=1 Tax=Stachybotrys chlorohalonatus (strain IBT 40285) TaxID=1283841 RepID=A0A084QJ42_STAC4|nr:hypothetical protein S40285_05724 [Stachybotrys chlorohalonata IBT 40285]
MTGRLPPASGLDPAQSTYRHHQQNPHPHLQPHQQPHPQQPQPLPHDSSAVKLTRGTSCVLCQQRKVRCDKNKPCANCVKAGVECRVVPPQPPRRRKRRLQEKDLIERLKKYESLLSENGVKFDAIGQDLRADGHNLEDVDELENDFESLRTDPEASASPSNASHSQADRGPDKFFSFHKEFRASERMLQDTSDGEEINTSTIHQAFDRMFGNQDGFPFILSGQTSSVTHLHPPMMQIMQLWQVYIDNINPLLKITHVPTVQGQIIEATSCLENAPRNIEALMFGMYIMAIHSMEEAEVLQRFNATKAELLARFFPAIQQALVNASFMRVNDPICLQALYLYLMAVRWYVDPRQVFCLIGIAIRIAQRMGLHRDPGNFGLPPFEVEQRRRLWWSLVGYDRRIGEMTGSTVTALSTGGDCKLPLNVNDSDLHVDGKEPPVPHTGPTEMLFALTRMELSMAVSSNSNRDSFKINNPDKPGAAPSTPKPGPTIRLAGQDGPEYTLEGYCAHVEGTYLSQCDAKIPLHFFTLTMTRQALCKMRVMNFLVRINNADAMPLKEIERDNLFLQATQMVEFDNIVYSSESLRPFKWYAMHYFPFPAYMFIVKELRQRVSGPMVERAWDAVARNYDLRGLLSNLHSPMHSAFSGHFIRAWQRHENHQLSTGRPVAKPYFIYILEQRAEERRQAHAANLPAPEEPGVTIPRLAYSSSAPSETQTSSNQPRSVGQPVGSSPTDDSSDMDFSYMMKPYQDLGSFTTGGGSTGQKGNGGFGGPLGGFMGGMGGAGMGGPGGGRDHMQGN